MGEVIKAAQTLQAFIASYTTTGLMRKLHIATYTASAVWSRANLRCKAHSIHWLLEPRYYKNGELVWIGGFQYLEIQFYKKFKLQFFWWRLNTIENMIWYMKRCLHITFYCVGVEDLLNILCICALLSKFYIVNIHLNVCKYTYIFLSNFEVEIAFIRIRCKFFMITFQYSWIVYIYISQ